VILSIVKKDNPLNWGALKILHKPEDARDADRAEARMSREIKAMRDISHPNLIRIIDADNNSKWFVMKYYPKGTLFKNNNKDIFKGDFVKALKSFRPLVEGVAKLHKQNYIHRDIKPQNIFIYYSDNLVLGDFGLAYYHEKQYDRISDSLESVGSRDWMPPWGMGNRIEIEKMKPTFDVFSLGKLLWSMVSGKILPHMYFNDPEYPSFNLEKIFPDTKFINLVNLLLRKCIVKSEKECLPDATALLEEVDKLLIMIDNNADWSDPTTPKLQCKVCNIGNYIERAYTDFSKGDVKEFGLNPGDHLMKIYTCSYCGNVQLFAKNPGKKIPDIWIGK
jgi:serine/threonine protein kinase